MCLVVSIVVIIPNVISNAFFKIKHDFPKYDKGVYDINQFAHDMGRY